MRNHKKKPTVPALSKLKINQRTLLYLALGAVVILLALLIDRNNQNNPAVTPYASLSQPAENIQAHITITAKGFAPATLSIRAGTNVTWTNQDNRPHRVTTMSDPAHKGLPGPDAKIDIAPGQSYSYLYGQSGTYGYFDSANQTQKGRIFVE